MEKILTDWQGPQAQQAAEPARSDLNKVETTE
jgi:hypothetical protein